MMFSTKAEYGVRVMAHLAKRDGEPPISLGTIADAEGLPLAYLEHLVQRLRKAGLVESHRGAHGGYTLARAADEITMADVVRALEGDIAPIECITADADGVLTCAREGARPVPDQAALDPSPGIHRPYLERHDPGRPRPATEEGHTCMTLEIQNLHVRTEDREILHGVDLVVSRGADARPDGPERLRQVHARQHAHGQPRATR